MGGLPLKGNDMTDKELLELAAKAAGIDERRLPDAWPNRFDDDQWNPLIDDADALRLAVKLNMDITLQLSFVEAWGTGKVGKQFRLREEHNNIDPYAATRRAIVRAAAAIGKSMGGL